MTSKPIFAATLSPPKAPRLRNISEVKGPLHQGTLIHFSAKQWKQMTARIPVEKGMPTPGLGLDCYPIPGGDVIVQPTCIANPCETCKIKVSGVYPDGRIGFDCQCQRDPDCIDNRNPPPPPPPNCALDILTTGGRIRIRCRSQGCSGRCRLRATQQDGRFVIACLCT